MLRLLLFPILLLVSTVARAQGFTPWNPFPHKQITMWQKPDGSHDLHYNDSMRVNGNVKEHFFGLEQYMKDIHDCDTAFYRVYTEGHFPAQQPYRPSIDSLSSENDVIWRFANPNRPFELRTHEPLNASWGFRFVNGNVFDSISMTVINIDTASFLGFFDSLKTIRMETFRQGIATGSFWDYKVSKSAGMVQYIPFEQIIRNQTPETWSIIGFDHTNGGHYGFTSSFEDFYSHFAPGDQYKWSFYARSSPVTGGISYSGQRMDSIIAVSRDVYGVTLTVQVNSNSNIHGAVGTVTRNILKSESIKSLFSRKLNTFVNVFPDSLPYKYMHKIFSETFSLDTVNFTAITQENLYSNIACIANGCVECLSKESYVRGLGLVSYTGGGGGGSPEYGELIGYQKAGQAPVGDMSPISGLGIVTSNPLRLFPNPAKNAVYLEGVSDNALVQVFDIHGKLMISTSYMLGAAIPTDDLNDGVYLVRVNDGRQLNVAKLVVSK